MLGKKYNRNGSTHGKTSLLTTKTNISGQNEEWKKWAKGVKSPQTHHNPCWPHPTHNHSPNKSTIQHLPFLCESLAQNCGTRSTLTQHTQNGIHHRVFYLSCVVVSLFWRLKEVNPLANFLFLLWLPLERYWARYDEQDTVDHMENDLCPQPIITQYLQQPQIGFFLLERNLRIW